MLQKVKNILYAEFVAGHTIGDALLLLLGLMLQIVAFCFNPDSAIVIVSGIAGVFTVVLSSQGKISNFLFGFLQVTTYLVVSYRQRLYGEVAINAFYFVSMIYGVWSWRKQYGTNADTGEASLKTRRLSLLMALITMLLVVAGSLAAGWELGRFTDDSQPMLDAFTTVPAIVAQILMVLRYRDQWYYWLIIDILAAVMWLRAGNISFMLLYMFWCIVCIYGFVNWSKIRK